MSVYTYIYMYVYVYICVCLKHVFTNSKNSCEFQRVKLKYFTVNRSNLPFSQLSEIFLPFPGHGTLLLKYQDLQKISFFLNLTFFFLYLTLSSALTTPHQFQETPDSPTPQILDRVKKPDTPGHGEHPSCLRSPKILTPTN